MGDSAPPPLASAPVTSNPAPPSNPMPGLGDSRPPGVDLHSNSTPGTGGVSSLIVARAPRRRQSVAPRTTYNSTPSVSSFTTFTPAPVASDGPKFEGATFVP